MEVLENIQEGGEELAKLSKKSSPTMNRHYDPDRITDYPRARSPDTHSPNWSRRSSLSLSAVSESSDSSSVISYDANKQPKKKILKNPHRKRKSSKNRVRWNLPGEGDTTSLRSFDSVSMTGEIYNQAKSSIAESRRKWRDADRNLSPHAQLNHRYYNQSLSASSLLNISPNSPSPSNSLSPHLLGGAPNQHARSFSASSIPHIVVSKEGVPIGEAAAQSSFHFPLSPLTNSMSSPSPSKTLQSTPKPHHQSDSILSRPSHREIEGASCDSPSSFDIDMPILKLDNSNLTDLEESTLEDRKRMHIFQFPQIVSPVQPAQQPPGLQRSVTASAVGVFLDDDDADDYDHLSPLHKPKKGPAKSPEKKVGEKSAPQDHMNGPSNQPDHRREDSAEGVAYSEGDIEEALGAMGGDSDRSSHTSSSDGSPETQRTPPIVVHNGRRGLHAVYSRDNALPVVLEEADELNWQTNQPNPASASPGTAADQRTARHESAGQRSADQEPGSAGQRPAPRELAGERSSQRSVDHGSTNQGSAGERSTRQETSGRRSATTPELAGQRSPGEISASSSRQLSAGHGSASQESASQGSAGQESASQSSGSRSGSHEAGAAALHVPDLIGTDYRGHKPKVAFRDQEGRGENSVQVERKAGEFGSRIPGRPDLVSSEDLADEKSDSSPTGRDEPLSIRSMGSSTSAASQAAAPGIRSGSDLRTDVARDPAVWTHHALRTHHAVGTDAFTRSGAASRTKTAVRTDAVTRSDAASRTDSAARMDTAGVPAARKTDSGPRAEAVTTSSSTRRERGATTHSNVPPQQVSPKNPRCKIPPPVPPKNFRSKKVPPPVPPKTKHIRRKDRDAGGIPNTHGLNLPPMLDNSVNNISSSLAVEDILPPPPEFAFSPSPPQGRKDASGIANHALLFDEILSSPSNSTLVPDQEESPERLVLETDHQYDRDSSSSSSSPSSHRQNKHSWSMIHHQKVKERSGGFRSDDDPSLGTGGDEGRRSKHPIIEGYSRSARSLSSERADPMDHRGAEVSSRTANVTTSPRHKHRTEVALLEGDVIPPRKQSLSHASRPLNSSQNSHRQKSGRVEDLGLQDTRGRERGVNSARNEAHGGLNSGSHDKHVRDRRLRSGSEDDSVFVSSTESSEESTLNPLALKRVPFRPAPPPPIPAHSRTKLSTEEQHMLPLLYPSSGRPHMMKPIVHDTEKHIQEMLMEIENENRSKKVNAASYGEQAMACIEKTDIWE